MLRSRVYPEQSLLRGVSAPLSNRRSTRTSSPSTTGSSGRRRATSRRSASLGGGARCAPTALPPGSTPSGVRTESWRLPIPARARLRVRPPWGSGRAPSPFPERPRPRETCRGSSCTTSIRGIPRCWPPCSAASRTAPCRERCSSAPPGGSWIRKDGIARQLEAISQIGSLRRFVGMVTDSRAETDVLPGAEAGGPHG